jgi:hypothetical protein
MAKTKKFSHYRASQAILKIMKQLGLRTTGRYNGETHTWLDHRKDESFICVGCNFIRISVTADGVSMSSSHALFGGWSPRTKIYRDFKKNIMGHVLAHYGK